MKGQERAKDKVLRNLKNKVQYLVVQNQSLCEKIDKYKDNEKLLMSSSSKPGNAKISSQMRAIKQRSNFQVSSLKCSPRSRL